MTSQCSSVSWPIPSRRAIFAATVSFHCAEFTIRPSSSNSTSSRSWTWGMCASFPVFQRMRFNSNSLCAQSGRGARILIQPVWDSVTGARGTGDLVVYVVLARGFFHRQPFYFLEGRGVVHHQRAIHFPHTDQCVFAVAREFGVRRGLARCGRERLHNLERTLVDDLDFVLVLRTHHDIDPGIGRVP